MHITVSTGQQNTWADFLAITLPRALEIAAEEHVELRRSVPRDVLEYMGVVHSDSSDPRSAFAIKETWDDFVIECLRRER